MEKIFISIASCRERFLEQTVLSAFHNAKNPENVYIGIFNVVIDDDPFKCALKNVKVENCFLNKPPGLGFSRKKAIDLCPADAEYILQIDAHMIFENNWDESLICAIKDIEKQYDKSIITIISPNWQIGENNSVVVLPFGVVDPLNIKENKSFFPPIVAYNSIENSINHSYPQTWGYASDWSNNLFMETKSISGCLTFSRKKMFQEIEHDERCHWGADEGVFAMRAWTRGYKIFTIRKTIAYHLNKDKNYRKIEKDWRDHLNLLDNPFNFTYHTIKNIFLGKETGKYAAPNIDSLKKYQEFCNFDFNKFYDILDLRN